MKVGIIKWFDSLKGFGVIGTPGNGEVFLHKSNCDSGLEDLEIGRLLIFEEVMERGKSSAKKVHIPKAYEDFTAIMDLLGSDKLVHVPVKITQKSKWGNPYISTDSRSYNVFSLGLKKLCKNLDFQVISEWVNTYYINELAEKRSNYFIDYCQSIEALIESEKWVDFPISDNFEFFGQNLNADILFNTWKNKAFRFIGYSNIDKSDDFEIPENVLWERKERLDIEALKRIIKYEFGETFSFKYFDWVIEESRTINLSEFIKTNPYEAIKVLLDFSGYSILENKLNESIKELFSAELTVEISRISSHDDFESYKRLFDIVPVKIPESVKSDLKELVKAQTLENCSGEVAFKLWCAEKVDSFDFEFVKTDFENENLERHSKILRLINSSDQRLELVRLLIHKGNWDYLFNLLSGYIKISNNLGYGFSLKEKLYDANFWHEKNGGDLINEVIISIDKISDPQLLTELFLKGFANHFHEEFVFATIEKYDISELKKLLTISEISYSLRVLKKRLELFTDIRNLSAILILGKDLLPSEEFNLLDKHCFENTTLPIYYELWLEKRVKIFPESHIITFFDDKESNYDKIDNWVNNDLVSSKEIAILLFNRLKIIQGIDDRISFYTSLNIIKKLTQIDVTYVEKIAALKNSFFQVALWFLGYDPNLNFDALKNKFIYFKPESQVLIIKKLFKLKKSDLFDLTIDKLEELRRISLDIYRINEVLNPEVPLDLSSDMVIESLKSYTLKGKFLVDSELISVVLRNMYEDKKRKFRIGQYFENCEGRAEGEFNWKNKGGTIKKSLFGDGKFYFKIEFPYDEQLVEKVKNLPGRKWNKEELHWGVPSTYEKEVLEFARSNRFFLDFDGNNYENNLHFAKFERKGIPGGIVFCEGRVSQKEDKTFKKKFWWCANQPCFENCETVHEIDDWENYTLLDFCKILGLNVDEDSKYGLFPNGYYYQFVSLINRFNRLLEKMYCRSCDQILYPDESSNYAAYTVVRFSCQNETCIEHRKVVYLNHCLNGKCNSIIDNRDSKRCHYENHVDFSGLYICSDCGSCCSHEMLSRRLSSLESNGGFIHPELRTKVSEQLGHLERAEYFCYKCGNDMTEFSPTLFKCNNCLIEYDLNKFKLNHPHKHLRRSNYPTVDDEPDF